MASPDPGRDALPVSPTSAELPAGGTVHPVTRWGTEVMHRKARPVTSYDEELRSLVADMVATMYAADGVGLAACQIGVDLAVFVFDCPDESGSIHRGVVCNPVLDLPEGKDRKLDDSEEGCLSYPGAFVDCARPDQARVVGQGLDGEDVAYEGGGLVARCLQHETDHTYGTVFGDRLNNRARKKLRKQMEDVAADYPEQWPVGAVSEDVSAAPSAPAVGGATGSGDDAER
jgi:peptide deformylase